MEEPRQDEPGALPPNPAGLDYPLQANRLDFQERGHRPEPPVKKSLVIASLAVVALIVVTYPYLSDGRFGKALSGSGNYPVPSGGTSEFFLKAGQFRSFDFAGHNVIMNYLSANPDHSIDVTMDGVRKGIGVARNGPCSGIRCSSSWTYKGMNFSIEPVTRKQNAAMSFDSWDTSELRVSVS